MRESNDPTRQRRIVVVPEPTDEEWLALLMALDRGNATPASARVASAGTGEDPGAPVAWTRIGHEAALRGKQWPLQVRSWSRSWPS